MSQAISVSAPQLSSPPVQTGTPRISATANTVAIPGTTAISGSGFNSGAAVQVYWTAQGGGTSSSGNIRAASDGSIAYTLALPVNAVVGHYSVYAQELGGQSSNVLTISATASSPAPVATAVSPSQASLDVSGQRTTFQVTLNGSDFARGATVRVYYARDNSYGGQFNAAGT